MRWLKLMLGGVLLLGFATMVLGEQRTLVVKTGDAQAQKRVALVIGNSNYHAQGVPVLRNPVNDARAMAKTLNGLGFEVIEVTDATQSEMRHAITAFGEKLSPNTVALVYYAGHGLQVGGKNYIVPVDANITSEGSVLSESVSMNAVLGQLEHSKLSIVILDACRNNPYEHHFRGAGNGGLAQMDAPEGTYIAYATAPGKTAEDGEGEHGLYTQALLKEINEPGLPLEEVFKRVRVDVLTESKDAQMPWDASSLTGNFYFKPGSSVQVVSVEPEPVGGGGVSLEDLKKQEEGQAGQVLRDCTECPEMVVIPAGSFEMGSNNGETDERPVHRVDIARPFALGKYEVTQGEWRALMGNNPSDFQDCGDRCPVEEVSWEDAQSFVRRLNERTGKRYRLPSEAEWEYACRGGGQDTYCGGEDVDALGWYRQNSGSHTHSVGQKQANGYGLYDMSGNVDEWVEDCYHDSYAGAPGDGSAWTEGDCGRRVLRGGSWSNVVAYDLHAAFRYGFIFPSFRVSDHGFRVARTLP